MCQKLDSVQIEIQRELQKKNKVAAESKILSGGAKKKHEWDKEDINTLAPKLNEWNIMEGKPAPYPPYPLTPP